MVRGKALLIVQKTDYSRRPFEVDAHIKTATCEQTSYIQEDVQLCAEENPPTTNLKVGETAWVWVTYILDYHVYHDYYSGTDEWDVDIEYSKIRILKRKRAPK